MKNYEDTDRQFAWEAKKLVKDKTTPVEKHDVGKSKIGEQVIHFGEGFLDSIVDLVKGLADSTVGIVKYDASFVTYLYGELSGNEIPKWADDYCYNTSVEANEKIKAVLDEPLIVVDGIKNGIQDTYEEKGVASNGAKVITKTAGVAEEGEMVASVGEDLAKLAGDVKTAAKVADTAEDLTKVISKTQTATKAEELSKSINGFSKNVNAGKQGKHILESNNYIEGRSVFNGTVEDAQKLVDEFAGTGEWIGPNKERVNFEKVIGKYVNPSTGESVDTTVGMIHYSKTGTHIVPAQPIE